MLQVMDVSASGLIAQRQRMNTIAGNIANMYTTADADGNIAPFQRRFVTFSADEAYAGAETGGGGVNYQVEVDTNTAPRRVYEPGHVHADADGYVSYPNINMVTEFVNALEASRAYEANVTTVEVTKNIAENTLRILV